MNDLFRVAIVGAGPSGFYAADYLLKQGAQVDLFDRLPTPFGLVRGGVAPDHQKIKSVTKAYDKIAEHPSFRFFGNVNFGTDILLEDVARYYHALILSVGAQTDKALGIPGEDLPGSHAATEFVGWYNGHPDYTHYQFDLTQQTAVVIGVGNVAMDVARILAHNYEELAKTDIADYALEALRHSQVKTVYILGRRGPVQAAFTPPEIKELGELPGADCIITPDDMELDPYSASYLASPDVDKQILRNVEIMREIAQCPPQGKPRRVIFRFLTSPVEIIGDDHVTAVKVVKNQLITRDDGSQSARATDQTEIIPAGLVFRSVGYNGVALPGIPFDGRRGIIPNVAGRVLTEPDGAPIPGVYTAGWIKRGPTGIIGTNKPDSVETAQNALADLQAGVSLNPVNTDPAAIERHLAERGVQVVTYADWLTLDQIERAQGLATGRPRVKFSRVSDMLEALRLSKQATP